jgi:hypothetical protein
MEPVSCSRCDTLIPPVRFNLPEFLPCPSCVNSPLSMVRTGKTRFVAAIVLSGLQIVAWAFVFTYLLFIR